MQIQKHRYIDANTKTHRCKYKNTDALMQIQNTETEMQIQKQRGTDANTIHSDRDANTENEKQRHSCTILVKVLAIVLVMAFILVRMVGRVGMLSPLGRVAKKGPFSRPCLLRPPKPCLLRPPRHTILSHFRPFSVTLKKT